MQLDCFLGAMGGKVSRRRYVTWNIIPLERFLKEIVWNDLIIKGNLLKGSAIDLFFLLKIDIFLIKYL